MERSRTCDVPVLVRSVQQTGRTVSLIDRFAKHDEPLDQRAIPYAVASEGTEMVFPVVQKPAGCRNGHVHESLLIIRSRGSGKPGHGKRNVGT